MGNVILNTDLTVRTTKLQPSNQLDELLFYIPSEYNAFDIFLLLKDENNNSDVIPLIYSKLNNNYKIYTIQCSNELKIRDGLCKVALLMMGVDSGDCRISEYSTIHLKMDKYNVLHKTYISRQLESYVAEMYDKIVQITNMNIEIYERISKEVPTSNDD